MKKKHPFTDKSNEYARAVVAGEILACKHVKQACARHQRDWAAWMEKRPDWLYNYDTDQAEYVCAFMEQLPHTKGKWAKFDPLDDRAHLLTLQPWQCFIICSIFGWIDKTTGHRRFNSAKIYVPRKNGKSLFGAGIGWYMFGYDNEPGAEVYSGATTEKQAMEVFKPAKQMGKRAPELHEECGAEIMSSTIIIEGDGSKFEPVIGKPGDGASPHCAIIDEYHEHADSTLHDTMKSGMGARDQPLILIISTAGSNLAGPCRDDWVECEKILDGTFIDETVFCIIYTCDPEDDWTSEEALRKANPNFDISVSKKFLLQELAQAKREPRSQARYKTKHLNLWVTSKNGYFNTERWRELAKPELKIEDFAGQPVFMASDFAAVSDLTVTMYLFPHGNQEWTVFGKYYLPEATVELPENQHYQKWRISGHLTVTSGNVTDIRLVEADVIESMGKYSVQEWLFDPRRVYGIVQPLQEAGVPVIELLTNAGNLSKAMKFLDDMIKAGRIYHNGDPILAWALSNVVAQENRKDEVYPTKETRANKIDPVVALLMAFSRAMAPVTTTGPGFFIAG